MASEPNFSINDGIHGELPDISPMQIGVISAFMALSLWIVFEFHVRVFRFFARRRGLYFWSLMVLSWGVVLHRYVRNPASSGQSTAHVRASR